MLLKLGKETNTDTIFREEIKEVLAHPFLKTRTRYPEFGEDCTLIEDILVYLSKDKSMDSIRAQRILDDAQKVLAFMDESRST